MNDRSATTSGQGSKAGSAARSSAAVRVRALVRSSTVTRADRRAATGWSWPWPTSTAYTWRGAALEQAVGEAAGRRPGIEGAPARRRRRRSGRGPPSSFRPPRLTKGEGGPSRTTGSSGATRRAAFSAGAPGHEDAARRRWPPGPPAGSGRGPGARARCRAGGGPRRSAGGLLVRLLVRGLLVRAVLAWRPSWRSDFSAPPWRGVPSWPPTGVTLRLAAAAHARWPSCRPGCSRPWRSWSPGWSRPWWSWSPGCSPCRLLARLLARLGGSCPPAS